MASSRRPDEANDHFSELDRDAQGVIPVEMHRFVCSRLPEAEAREVFNETVHGTVDRVQLAERLGLPPDSITESEFRRLSGMYNLWNRWASDDADGWIISRPPDND